MRYLWKIVPDPHLKLFEWCNSPIMLKCGLCRLRQNPEKEYLNFHFKISNIILLPIPSLPLSGAYSPRRWILGVPSFCCKAIVPLCRLMCLQPVLSCSPVNLQRHIKTGCPDISAITISLRLSSSDSSVFKNKLIVNLEDHLWFEAPRFKLIIYPDHRYLNNIGCRSLYRCVYRRSFLAFPLAIWLRDCMSRRYLLRPNMVVT